MAETSAPALASLGQMDLQVLEGGRRSAPVSAVERHIGRRLRLRRTLAAMTQEDLAAALGVSVQQVRKFESGASRLGAERLYRLGRALGVPAAWFFEGMPAEAGTGAGRQTNALPPGRMAETLDLMRDFFSIGDPLVRRRLTELMRAMAAAGDIRPAGGGYDTRGQD